MQFCNLQAISFSVIQRLLGQGCDNCAEKGIFQVEFPLSFNWKKHSEITPPADELHAQNRSVVEFLIQEKKKLFCASFILQYKISAFRLG